MCGCVCVCMYVCGTLLVGSAPLKQLFPSSRHKIGVLLSDIGVGAVLLGTITSKLCR